MMGRLVASSPWLVRPMQTLQLNHVALHVADVAASVAFYRDVLRLAPLDRPAFDFPGAWFQLGVDQELHLIGDRDLPVHSHHRGGHFALVVDDLDQWEAHLDAQGAEPIRRLCKIPTGTGSSCVCCPQVNLQSGARNGTAEGAGYAELLAGLSQRSAASSAVIYSELPGFFSAFAIGIFCGLPIAFFVVPEAAHRR
jgi:lactoylglutathione lyase